MKTIKTTILLFATTLFIIGCSSDDNNNSGNPPDDTTNELIEALIADVTGGGETIWKIDTAILTNSNVTDLDVSDAFNITDDEFIFKTGTNTIFLEYKQGNSFNEDATENSDFLLDYYRSAENSSLSITDIETKTFADSNKSFTYNSDTNMTAELAIEGATLSIEMSPKTNADFASPPSGGLTFTEAFTFESNAVFCCSPGMIGSYSDNSFFIVTREDGLNEGNGSPERIIKFNLNDNTSEEKLFFQTDFVSKQLHIQNNKLIALGGQNVNTYNLDLSGEPTSISHGKTLTRHGVSVQDDDMYIVGGDLNNNESNKIFKWNIITETITEVATLPEPRVGARATIVDSKLYIAGGSEEFLSNPAKNTLYAYDIENDSFETYMIPQELNYTFVDRYENLVYVAGRIDSEDGTNRDLLLGVFNTTDNTFQEITTNLDDSDEFSTIHGMCIFNNKIYVIYGASGIDNGGQFPEWSIMAADL